MKFELERGQVLTFVVQLECRFEGGAEFVPVVRYDTAHGFAHCDRLHPYDETNKVRLATQDYNEALTFALDDLAQSWQQYRRRYLEWPNRK